MYILRILLIIVIIYGKIFWSVRFTDCYDNCQQGLF